jgi:Methyltransferase domain
MQPRVAAAATPSSSWGSPARGIRSLVRIVNVRLIKPAMKTLIPASWLRQVLHHRSRRWDARFHSQPAVDVFTAIYKEAKWGAGPRGDYYSGTGSHDPQVVRPYVEAVSAFLQSLPTPPSLVDLGCGDFNIGRQLRRYCGKYIACDVVPGLISRNQAKFSDADVDFRCLDITQGDFPDADVALLRQVLQHLSSVQILQIVPSLYRYRFLLVSEHLPVEPDFPPNIEKPAGAMIRLFLRSGVILTEPPFNLKVKSTKVICSNAQAVDHRPGLVRTTLYEL